MDVIKNTLKLANSFKRVTMDGLENMLTGLGVEGKDKRSSAKYKYKRKSYSELENFHDSSDIAKVVVNKIPSLGTKRWINHKVSKEEGGAETANKLVDEDDRLGTKEKFKKAWAWSRLYGGAAIYISVQDGLDPREPLNLNRVFKVNTLNVFHKDEISYGDLNYDINSPNFDLPEHYTLGSKGGVNIVKIHHSRILRFEGSPLSEQGFRNNSYWHDSFLSVIYEIVRDYDSAYNGVFHALQDFSVDIVKLKDLADMCGSEDGYDILKKRIMLMQLSKSIMSSIAIDAEGESFEKLERAFANVDKVLERCDKRLQLATGLPHTVLFGEGAKGGLGSNGESEQSTLNDMVAEEQDRVMTCNLDYLGIVIQSAKQGPTKGKTLSTWTYSYNPLTEPSEKEKSESRLNMAKADEIYLVTGALSPEEVAESRFGGDEYSIETSIDMDSREEAKLARNTPPEEVEKEIK